MSLFYYKDIILVKRGSIDLTIVNPLKSKIIISQFENLDESNTNEDEESKRYSGSQDFLIRTIILKIILGNLTVMIHKL